MIEISDKERKLLRELQNDFKLEARPFKRIALELGLSEDEVLEIIRKFQNNGIIRRIGVAIRPEKAGHKANAMVTWVVPEERVEEVCKSMSARSEISHCYDRDCPPGWLGNVFTMIHGCDEENLLKIMSELTELTGIKPHQIFRTVRELKKTSMRYFTEEESR